MEPHVVPHHTPKALLFNPQEPVCELLGPLNELPGLINKLPALLNKLTGPVYKPPGRLNKPPALLDKATAPVYLRAIGTPEYSIRTVPYSKPSRSLYQLYKPP